MGKKDLGKQLCTVTTSYADWVKSRAKMIKLPYPWEPSMCIKAPKPPAVVTSEVDLLKEIIKKLEKENAGLRSSLIKVTSEKNTLKANLSQKRERFNKADTDIQIEQNKRRKAGDSLKGSFETIANKKKELVEARYRACKREIDYQGQIKSLQDLLEKSLKELKDEQDRAKKLETTLEQLQSDTDKRFEEIRSLNRQAHRNLEKRKQLKEEATQWEIHSRHLQVLLDQKEEFMQDILNGLSLSLIHNLVRDAQYWTDRHARLAEFASQSLEDLPGLLKKAYADMFPHNTPKTVFHFVSVCRVVMGRIKPDLHASASK